MIVENSLLWSMIAWAKTFWYWLCIFSFTYLNIPQEQLSILWMLMFIDTITGVLKQYRIDPKMITSHELSMGVLKKFVTVIIVFVIALIGKWAHFNTILLVEWWLSILIMAEWYSALQNIYAVRTGIILPEFDVISLLLSKIWILIKEQLDKLSIK